MIRPSSALTRYGILAAVLLLALLGLQRVVSFRRELVREGDRLKTPPDAVGESVDTERPPEPRLVADALHPAAPHPSSSASRRPDSAVQSSSDSSSPSQSVARSYPWQRTLAQLGDPVDGRRLCFTPLKAAPGGDPVAWLSDWFEDLGGESPSLVSIDQARDRQVALRGWVRLRPPLRRDVTLRLGLAELDALVIHAWSGLAGASLVYRGDGRAGWEGYRTERSAVQIEPTSRQLVTRDGGRWLRREMSSGQPIELRYREGQLVLSCGQTVLLSVPLAREPAEVYVTGATVVRGIGFQRSRGFPLPDRAPANRRSLAIDTLGWTGGRVAKTAVNDIVTLTAKGGESVWATVPALGLREVVVELSEARYGVGVFLGDRRGTPRCVVRLLPGATETEPALFTSTAVAPPPAPRGLEAVRGGPYWVRLVVGCGLVRGWVSRDGFRWLELDTVLRVQRAELASVGFLVPDRGPQSRIQLRRLHVGRLPALGALAALERASQAVSCADAATWKDWERRVEEARPATVSADVWNAGCAFSTLQADSTIPYAARLMDDVLDQATRWVPQVPDRLRMFEAVSELVDLRETHRLEAMVARFHRLADDWARERGGEAYAQVRATLLTLPLDTDISFQATRFTAVRRELVHALVAGDSQSTLDLCQRARFDQTADAPGEHSWIAWA
ncbi:MAG: hypothetical protein CMJ59_06035, partial [Planctomycetaceae bacterium]|nr:hypothetical protein [Planctomycetaceae bacterium]